MAAEERESNLEAYKQCTSYLRHYSDLRFKITTVFLVITGATFKVAIQDDSDFFFWCASISGFVIAALFYSIERRVNTALEGFADVSDQLEASLGITAFAAHPSLTRTKRSRGIMIEARYVIYGGTALLWLLAAVHRLL